MSDLRKQIEELRRTAETGEQWAEICRLEEEAVAAERNQQVANILLMAGLRELPSSDPRTRVFSFE